MVRFIIYNIDIIPINLNFIYIPIWLDLLFYTKVQKMIRAGDLHSNMVRFII